MVKRTCKYKSKERKNVIRFVEMFYKAEEKLLNYLIIIPQWYNKNQFIKKGPKSLTSKQMLQRLPIVPMEIN